jgi:hypothetical protein
MAKTTTVAKKARPAKRPAPAKPAKAAKRARRVKWLDPKTQTPLIDGYARKMKSYLKAFADGVITDDEIEDQEKRLASLMKDIEPRLDDALHEQVTRLLCEISVYDLMQVMHSMQQGRPATQFRG